MNTFVNSGLFVNLSCALSLSGVAVAQTATLAVFGGPGDQLGYAVSGAGDVNGDGFDDFVVGAPYAGVGELHVRLQSGLDGSLLWGVADESGPGTGGALGWSVGPLGDVNGDGIVDLVAGAPSESVDRFQDGSAKVLSGRDGSTLFSFHGDRDNDRFGSAVAGAGDVNGDGVADVVVGVEAPLSRRGYVRVFSGATGDILRTIWEPSPPDRTGNYGGFGAAVGAAGDVDGDGRADFVVGAFLDDGNSMDSGSATVFSGSDGHAIHVFHGDAPGDYLGTCVASAGDVDGDGVPDVIAGAPGYTNPQAIDADDVGLARVYSGRTGAVLHSFTGDVRDRFFGMSVHAAGDVNGDGFADVIVGTFGYVLTVNTADYAIVFSGRDGAALFRVLGSEPHDGFAWAVGGAGDVNGDGFSDVIVGAYKDDTNGMRAGRAIVYLGRSDSGLTLGPPSPGVAGILNVLAASGATPGATVRFVYGRRLGLTPVPGCGGPAFSIVSPTAGPVGISGSNGRATVSVPVPAGQAGRTYLVQAIEPARCRVSNLVTVTLR